MKVDGIGASKVGAGMTNSMKEWAKVALVGHTGETDEEDWNMYNSFEADSYQI